jgi:sphingomyelin phosphodiesterase acid-like 3
MHIYRDSVPHVNEKDLDLDKVFMLIGNVTAELMSVFQNTTIYPVLGNHDPYPSNMMPYDVEDTKYYKDILDVSGWRAVLGQNESKQFMNGKFFCTYLKSYWLSHHKNYVTLLLGHQPRIGQTLYLFASKF